MRVMLLELVPNAVLVLLAVGAVAWVLVLIGIAVLKRHAVRWVPEEGGRHALGAAGLVWIMRTYTRLWHRLDAYGMDSIPDLGLRSDASGRPIGGERPVIVIAVEAGVPNDQLKPNPIEEQTHFSMPKREDVKKFIANGHRFR